LIQKANPSQLIGKSQIFSEGSTNEEDMVYFVWIPECLRLLHPDRADLPKYDNMKIEEVLRRKMLTNKRMLLTTIEFF